jgi:hypothetical protein
MLPSSSRRKPSRRPPQFCSLRRGRVCLLLHSPAIAARSWRPPPRPAVLGMYETRAPRRRHYGDASIAEDGAELAASHVVLSLPCHCTYLPCCSAAAPAGRSTGPPGRNQDHAGD